MARTPRPLDEFGLIGRYFAPLAATEPGAYGLTDDAAVLELAPGEQLVVTTDAMVAGVHFPADDPPALIARKLLRVNLSDLASMGARPRGYTLAAVLPRDTDESWIAAFAEGLAADQGQFGVALVGGDTVSTGGPATFSITAMGVISGGSVLRRNGAQAGDDVYVSGTIGDAMLGLAIVQERIAIDALSDRDFLIERFRLPTPRLDLGTRLLGIASAAADVSDGLVADLGHICETSACAAEIIFDDVPISAAARRLVTGRQSLQLSLLAGGDDYELVFAAPVAVRDRVTQLSGETGVPLTRIGRFIEAPKPGGEVTVVDATGSTLELGNRGYRHFHEHTGRRNGGQ
jgi:thiamine-monophosphate kinase